MNPNSLLHVNFQSLHWCWLERYHSIILQAFPLFEKSTGHIVKVLEHDSHRDIHFGSKFGWGDLGALRSQHRIVICGSWRQMSESVTKEFPPKLFGNPGKKGFRIWSWARANQKSFNLKIWPSWSNWHPWGSLLNFYAPKPQKSYKMEFKNWCDCWLSSTPYTGRLFVFANFCL